MFVDFDVELIEQTMLDGSTALGEEDVLALDKHRVLGADTGFEHRFVNVAGVVGTQLRASTLDGHLECAVVSFGDPAGWCDLELFVGDE